MGIFKKRIKAKDVHNFNDEQLKNIIDIRENYDFRKGHIKNSRNINSVKLLNNPTNYIKEDKEYYIICYSGVKSKIVTSTLKKQGFNNITNLSGGFRQYEQTKIN